MLQTRTLGVVARRRLQTTACSAGSVTLARTFTSGLSARRASHIQSNSNSNLSPLSLFARFASLSAVQPSIDRPMPPPIPHTSQESYGNFDLVQRIKLDYADIVLEKWTSRETGLSVVHLDYACKHNGYVLGRICALIVF